ncbi:hypothetical protein ACFQS4_02095 [Saliphagus sp. GCM10025317]
MADPTRERFRQGILQWAEDNLRDFPWREPDRTLYEVFVAEFFLTQTPAENVRSVYPDFLSKYPTIERLEEAPQDEIEEVIEPLGFQRMRAEALTRIADRVDTLPADEDELLELPRVGPYVANATLCFALDQPRVIADRNVVRVYDRVFREEFPEKESERREFATEMLPEDGSVARTYNLALLDFGALVCTKRSPRCASCFANEYCSYYRSSTEGE